jgi:hypothetical protein
MKTGKLKLSKRKLQRSGRFVTPIKRVGGSAMKFVDLHLKETTAGRFRYKEIC